MIRFGISWVARLLGVSGFTVQQPTTRGSLQDLNISERVIPFNPSNLATKDSFSENPSEATQHLKRFQDTQTKLNSDSLLSEASNDQDLVSVIATLKSKLYQESIKSKHTIQMPLMNLMKGLLSSKKSYNLKRRQIFKSFRVGFILRDTFTKFSIAI